MDNIYNFVRAMGGQFKEKILARDGVFVVRPDSTTREHGNPEELVEWILHRLDGSFGSTVNSKGYKVLHPKVRILWGDGIDIYGIQAILNRAIWAGYSAENLVFGMGGGLLQKVNRDTQRFAFKSSAQYRNGKWHDVFKDPVDSSKKSKKGRLSLVRENGNFKTIRETDLPRSILEVVFENGDIKKEYNFRTVRTNASL